jgi:ABC-2 type transport system ATP-binding protein
LGKLSNTLSAAAIANDFMNSSALVLLGKDRPTQINFKAVTKRFPDGTLGLQEASWEVKEGVSACLLGPPGSGKTTAVRVLEGALEPTGGSVLLLGVNIANRRRYREIRKQVGIVPQGPGMYADRTVGEYLALACSLYSDEDRVVTPDEAEQLLGLTEYRHTRMTYLSTNYQRRLALAAALVANPRVLILDEPTAGLDPLAAQDLRGYLEIAMRGRTALLCTHNQDEAQRLCTYAVTLRGGRVVAKGTWDEIREGALPRLRVAAREGVDRLLAELQKFGFHAWADQGSVLVEVQNVRKDGPDILRKLLTEARLDVYECAPARPAVEGVFAEASR